ncbi:lipid-binding SYLF domain-containing protein [Acidocella sp.]|uniref:lipid-binding SYLF domain-containing protein n=1 Tax=Acidocella sp. TaxID=50710 RepID=UPI00260EFFD5|nr:lipid-binding SYLF domain-containing protein [Acidocella sp.]MDD2795194.1 lipid-binding SYLF domain-containing protein [Acidocella sp.]
MKTFLLGMAIATATLGTPAVALAGTPQHLVDSSTLAVEDMMGGAEGSQAQTFLRKAKAVVVCPDVFRAGFFIGGEGGGCVMVARTADGSWSYPAFYNMGSGSFGLQIGVQNAEVMMLIMTNGGLNAILNSQFKLGADAGLAVATLGAGVSGAMSTAINADILTFSKAQGLYGGISLSGSVLSNDAGTEQAYYGQQLDARQIVVDGQGSNPGANPLRTILTRYGQ